MVEEMIQLFLGYTVVLLFKENTLVNGHECKETQVEGKLSFDCTAYRPNPRGYPHDFPHDINPAVQYLDLSYVMWDKADDNSFKKYPNLIGLKIRKTLVTGMMTSLWFLPLTKLEDLDISQLDVMGGSVVFQWPPNIKKLNLSQMSKYDVNVASLTKLEVLDASGNIMNQYPQCNMWAPLHTVNVSNNPLNELKVEFLAPYCKLKHLSMNLYPESLILKEDRSCDCLRINLWMNQFGILANSLDCTVKEGEKCDLVFNDQLLEQRRECLGETQHAYPVSLFLAIGVLALLTLFLILVAYRYTSLRKHVQPADFDDTPEPPEVSSLGEGEGAVEEDGTLE